MENHYCQAEDCINPAGYFHFKGPGKQKVCAEHMLSDKPVYHIQLFALMAKEDDYQSAKERLAQAEECRDYLNQVEDGVKEEAEAARKALENARLKVLQCVERVFDMQKRVLEQFYECAVAELQAARRELKRRENWRDVGLTEGLIPKQVAGFLQFEVADTDLELCELLQSSFFLQTSALPIVLASPPQHTLSRTLYSQAAQLKSAEHFLHLQKAAFLCKASKRLSPFKRDFYLHCCLAKKIHTHTLSRTHTLRELLSQEAHIMPAIWEKLTESPADTVTKYKKVIELSQSSEAATICLKAAEVLSSTKEKDALFLCSHALNLLLQHSSSLVKSACCLFAQLHTAAGTSASSRLREVLRQTGSLPEVVLELAKSELIEGDLKSAEVHLEEAYTDSALVCTVRYLQGDLHMKRNAHKVAEQCYREALQGQLSLAQLLHIAEQCTLMGATEACLECCTKAEQAKPNASEYLKIAHFAQICNSIGTAERYYTKALENLRASGQEEALAHTWQVLGELYQSGGDLTQAERCYSEALSEALVHKLLGVKPAELSQRLGLLQDSLGEHEKAEKSLLIALRMGEEKEKGQVQLHLAWLYTRMENRQRQALGYFQSALSSLHTVGDTEGLALANDRLGRYYFAQEQYAEAVKSYTQALQYYEALDSKHKKLADTYFHLGMACLASKQLAEAHHYLQESLRVCKQLSYEEGVAAAEEALALLD